VHPTRNLAPPFPFLTLKSEGRLTGGLLFRHLKKEEKKLSSLPISFLATDCLGVVPACAHVCACVCSHSTDHHPSVRAEGGNCPINPIQDFDH
jgi:hypothetical protein